MSAVHTLLLATVWCGAAALPALTVAAPVAQPSDPAVASASAHACRVLDAQLQGAYTGGCVNGLAQGQGVARGANGAWYRGEFVAGLQDGQGTKLYTNGDAYSGHWRAGRRDGYGRYEYGAQSPWRGDVYQGQWQADKQHGQGTYIFYPAGDRFSSQWQAGVPQAAGTPTLTRRKRAYEALAPVLGQPGLRVCSTSTEGASADNIAQGTVLAVLDDRIQIQFEDDSPVLQRAAQPQLNPRWEIMTDWLPCHEP